MRDWIWQQDNWPHFSWQTDKLQSLLRQVYDGLGQLKGKASLVDGYDEFSLDALLANIVASSEIESEQVDIYGLRSSLARQLGVDDDNPVAVSDKSEGLANLMRAAVTQWQEPLQLDTLLQWHAWLFQGHQSLLQKVDAGQLRGNEPMQIVSGPVHKPKVHFEAPPHEKLEQELNEFISWFNDTQRYPDLDPVLRAGITHLWFVTIHPFEDGNGRITRALTDRALAQADKQGIRLYAMSEAILQKRRGYYEVLELTQKSDCDITPWLTWFCETLLQAVNDALKKIERTLFKTRFWNKHSNKQFLEQQVKVLNRLLSGDFEQGISAAQYQKVARVSKATATRHLSDLVEDGLLTKLPGGGRSTRYQIAGLPHQV